MRQAYRLTPIPTLPTQEIRAGSTIVGYLYAPNAMRPLWEIYPVFGANIGGLPDGDRGYTVRAFATEEQALGFLGIGPAEAVAA